MVRVGGGVEEKRRFTPMQWKEARRVGRREGGNEKL